MAYNKPDKIVEITIENGVKKSKFPLSQSLILGFQAGAFIALGFLLYVRATAPLTGEAAGFSNLIGGSVFPIGLILTLLAGGELLTGNMMVLPLARYAKKISTKQLLFNWFIITISNFVGSIFIAYFFGHVVGLTETGPYLDKTVDVAGAKLQATFWQAFFSGIGCNYLVTAAVWLCYGAEDITGKVLGIWVPTMTFVAVGFQHVVANMFIIPAAIFAGHYTWMEYLHNFVPVFLGNMVGGSVFIAMAYWYAYKKKDVSSISANEYPLASKKGA
ncbi:MAG TPA: formate/nitrite transporter family protein [Bacillales bacterium]|nr:formate/nitrite transporter family protein [Bacillales bacterium]